MTNSTPITLENDTPSRGKYSVIIEWHGQSPPQSWYRRLHTLVGRIGRDVDTRTGVIERRAEDGKGIQLQEGCIITDSLSLAKMLADYAYNDVGDYFFSSYEDRVAAYEKRVAAGDEKAREPKAPRRPQVAISENNFIELKLDSREQRNVRAARQVLAARGRTPKTESHVVTCFECAETFDNVQAPRGRVVSCPQCSGIDIHARTGSQSVANVGGISSAVRAFAYAHLYDLDQFEAPKAINFDVTPRYATERLNGQDWQNYFNLSPVERAALNAMLASDELEDLATTLIADGRADDAMRLLRGIFIARAYRTSERRTETRVATITKFFQRGGNPTQVSFAEMPTADVLDASSILGIDETLDFVNLAAVASTAAKQTKICYNCNRSFNYVHGVSGRACDRCHSEAIEIVDGERRTFAHHGENIVDFWIATRFANGDYLPAELHATNGEIAPTSVDYKSTDIENTVAAFVAGIAPIVGQALETMDTPHALSALDYVYRVSNERFDGTMRTKERTQAFTALVKAGYDPADVNPFTDDSFGIVDLASYNEREAIRALEAQTA